MAVHQTTASIIVGDEAARVFGLWSDYARFPEFMPRLTRVRQTGERTSHWEARGPLGRSVEWDAEVTRFEPEKRIAWSSNHEGDVRTSGQVTFNPMPGGQTQVTVVFQYATSAARDTVAQALGNVADLIRDGLRRFKAHAEGREARG